MKMDRNAAVRAARALLNAARELVAAGFSHPDVEIKDGSGKKVCVMSVKRMKLDGMRYEADFVCVEGAYNDMRALNPILREEKFQWVRDFRVWAKYWRNCDWDAVEKRLSEAAAGASTPADGTKPVESGAHFVLDLVLQEVGAEEQNRFNRALTTRMLKFVDLAGNTYRAWPDSRRLKYPGNDGRFWSDDGNAFAKGIDGLVGQMFTVSGKSKRTTVRGDHWDVYFTMD